MNIAKTLMYIVISFLTFGSMGVGTSFATTYYCDNDRAASQYPNCSTSYSGHWQYRSGQSGDWNKDDRLGKSSSGGGYYDWKFTNISGGSNARLFAWLSNASFTNRKAEYSVDTDVIGYINQNTAPSGWNGIGSHYLSGSSAFFQVGNHDFSGNTSTATGADIIRIETYNGLTNTPFSKFKEQAYHKNPQIASIQKKMLNAADYYRDVKGTYQITFPNIKQNETIDFMISESKPGSYVKVTDLSGKIIEQKSDGKSILTLNHAQKTWKKNNVSSVNNVVGSRHYINDIGQPVYMLRQDKAFAFYANDVTLPQNYAFWLNHPSNHVVGHTKLFNRDVTVIEGEHDPLMSAKLGAKSYKMWVDKNTGVLLRLEGKNEKGKPAYFIWVKGIHFDKGVNLAKFSTEVSKTLMNWKNISLTKN